MKKLFVDILILLLFLIVVDVLFGYANRFMIKGAKGGQTYCQEYICNHSNEDIIMMGSSRMRHHYNPDVISEGTGMTCYNAGEDGGGIILNYGFYQMLTLRYTPKIILYDLTEFDFYEGDNEKYLGWLRKYYDNPKVKEIIDDVSPSEAVKNLSNLYRYNTRCIATIGDYFHPVRTYNKGYSAINGVIDYEVIPQKFERQEVDQVKMGYLVKFIEDTRDKGIELFLFASPQFEAEKGNDYYAPIDSLAKEYGVHFFNHFYDENISWHKEYFHDKGHMNGDGANYYSEMIVSELKKSDI